MSTLKKLALAALTFSAAFLVPLAAFAQDDRAGSNLFDVRSWASVGAGLAATCEANCRKSSDLAAAPLCSVTGALATVDVQDLASDERGVFQKQDRVDNVLNFSHASDRMQICKELMCFGSMHRRLHDAGSNGVNPNSFSCVLDRQGFCGCV